jgi:hypothetical protein
MALQAMPPVFGCIQLGRGFCSCLLFPFLVGVSQRQGVSAANVAVYMLNNHPAAPANALACCI